tara:strand:- start:6838 stop:8028 length:1191 start_codon:yes stop_codon:yes gene_type:complete
MAGPGDIINSPEDAFRTGVLETAGDVPVVFIDPNDFSGLTVDIPKGVFAAHDDITDAHRQIVKDALDSSAPGFSDTLSDDVLTNVAQDIVNNGPHAFWFNANDTRYCMASGFHDSIDNKEELVPLIAHETIDNLGAIPGTDAEWQHLVGRHEGAHCDDPSNPEPPANEDERVLTELRNETENDRIALQDPDGHISPAVIDAYKDARGLVVGDAQDDFDHANGILLDTTQGEPTQAHVDAARSVVPSMISGVAQELGISEAQAQKMRTQDPQGFIGAVESQLDKGGFTQDTTGADNPLVRDYITDYVDAYKDQVLKGEDHGQLFYNNTSPIPIGDGAPVVVTDLADSKMQIGTDRAPDYFAKVADPALAQQRMDMMAAMSAENSTDQTMALNTAKLG